MNANLHLSVLLRRLIVPIQGSHWEHELRGKSPPSRAALSTLEELPTEEEEMRNFSAESPVVVSVVPDESEAMADRRLSVLSNSLPYSSGNAYKKNKNSAARSLPCNARRTAEHTPSASCSNNKSIHRRENSHTSVQPDSSQTLSEACFQKATLLVDGQLP